MVKNRGWRGVNSHLTVAKIGKFINDEYIVK